MRTEMTLKLLLRAALLLAFLVPMAHGEDGPHDAAAAEIQAAGEAAEKAARPGPADIPLGDKAVLKLPAGFKYVPPAESRRLMESMGNPGDDALLGIVVPQESGEEPSWFVVMRYIDSGYIRDDDAKDWNADELLQNLKDGTEQVNEERRKRGIPEMQVLGWVEPPKYDAATHRLVWSASSKNKAEPGNAPDGVNYNTYALGRSGYVSLNLVTGYESVERNKPVARQLLAALEFNDGQKYTQFDSSTDRVAEYGLAALVGGIAAKKLGLIALAAAFVAKFAKVIGLGAVAALGIGAKLFGRRKKDDARS